MKIKSLFVLFSLALVSLSPAAMIDPTWESLAANYKVPEWFQDGKFGVWFHWGVPSGIDENRPNDGSHYGRRMYGANEGETGKQLEMTETLSAWHTKRYGPPSEFGYEDLVPLFKAEKWDPDALVKFVKDNGARFIMPVACHHDNFDMYDSFHPWNSVKMGPKRDTLKEWKEAATKHGLKFGVSTHLYWSPRFFANARKYQKPGTLEWKLFNMDYDPRGYATQDSWNEHWYARCWEIIEKYDPDMFNNDSPYPKIGGGKGLGIKLFTDFINRDLEENGGKQTVVLSFKDGKKDKAAFTYNLERGSAGEIKPEPWIWATDLSGGWFYRKGAVNRMSIPVMVGNAVDAISKNGVVMLNIALRGDGTLPENQAAYLTAFGDFLKINGEGIYGTRPWKTFGEGPLKMKDGRQGENHSDFSQQDIRFTQKDGNLYAFVLAPPTKDIVIKTLATGGLYGGEISDVTMLGSKDSILWKRSANGLTIKLPKKLPGRHVIGFRIYGNARTQTPAPLAKPATAAVDDIVPPADIVQASGIVNGGFSINKVSPFSRGNWMERSHACTGWVSPESGGWTISGGAARSSGQLLGQVNRVTTLEGSALRLSFDWTPSAKATGKDLLLLYRVIGWHSDKGNSPSDDFGRMASKPKFNGLSNNATAVDLLTGSVLNGKSDSSTGTKKSSAGVTQTFTVDMDLSGYGEAANDLSGYDYIGIFFQCRGKEPGQLDNVTLTGAAQPAKTVGEKTAKVPVATVQATYQSSGAAGPLAGRRPNIVLVMTDDQGMGDLSCMGNQVVKTPHIDRFHDKAVRFTDFQVSPTCAPTRAALMSGRAPFKNGVTHTILQRERMALDTFTLPQALKSAGYATGIFGKWHLGDEEAYLPGNRGFDEVLIHGAGGIGQTRFGDFPPNEENLYFDNVLLHNDTIVQTKGFCTDLFFQSGLVWIKKQHEAKKPYFAYIAPNAPHAPLVAPEKYTKRFLDLGYDKGTAGRYGMIENIDDNFGRLMNKLAEWKALDNTLVIFMTDNGATHLSGKLNGKRVRHFNFNMRGAKNSPNEGGTHVPAFWQWKGVLGKGVDIDALTAHIDLYKTFCELANVKLPAKMQELDGRSLLPLLTDPKADWPDRELFVHCGRWNPGKRETAKFVKCAVRTERWRFVNNAQLYDISVDPGETTDVVSAHPEVVSRLRKSFDKWWASTLPLMVNEGLPRVAPEDQPLAIRYTQQLKGKGIPKWSPAEL